MGGCTRGRKRNSEREYVRRGFEECHEKFGVEVTVLWRDEVSNQFLDIIGHN